jgi:hypothetical protein
MDACHFVKIMGWKNKRIFQNHQNSLRQHFFNRKKMNFSSPLQSRLRHFLGCKFNRSVWKFKSDEKLAK